MKGRSDADVAADVAALEADLHAVGARPTIDDAADAARRWASTTRGPLQARANFVPFATGDRNPTFNAALEIVVCYVIEHPDFVDWLARRCADDAKSRGAIARAEHDAAVKRIAGQLNDARRELARRGVETRRAKLERELADLGGGAA